MKCIKIDTVRSLQIFKILRFSFVIPIAVFMAKSSLSIGEIGIYETLLFIGTATTFFWVTGGLNALLAAHAYFLPDQRPVFLFQVFLLFVAATTLLAAVLWLGRVWAIPFLTRFDQLPHYGWLVAYLWFNLPTFLVEYIYLLHQRPRQILMFGLFSFGGQFGVTVVPLFAGGGLHESFVGLFILAVLKFLWLLVVISRYARPSLDWVATRRYVAVAVPLILYALVGGAMEYVDGLLISRHFDERTFAVFRNGAREFPLTQAVFTAAAAALIPLTAENPAEGFAHIRRRTLRAMHFLFPLSGAMMFVSPWMFPLLFNPNFADSAKVMNIYLLLVGSRALLPSTILMAKQLKRPLLVISLFEVAANFALSLLLLKPFGMYGVAMATVVAYLLEKLLQVAFLYWRFRILPNEYIAVGWYSFHHAVLVICFVVSWQFFWG